MAKGFEKKHQEEANKEFEEKVLYINSNFITANWKTCLKLSGIYLTMLTDL